MENIVDYINANSPEWIKDTLGAILIVILARLLIALLQRAIRRTYHYREEKAAPERRAHLETSSKLLCSIVKYMIWLFAIAAALGLFGLTGAMTSLLTTAGIGGIALGIGAQSFIKDVVAGVFMMFEDQIRVGDYVELAGRIGTVEEIALRNTTLRGLRGERIQIPNGSVEVLTNYSRAEYLAVAEVSIAYEADVALARALMLEETERYAEETGSGKAVPLGVSELGDSGVKLKVALFTDVKGYIQAERVLKERILLRFQKEGVEIPYNKLVILDGNKA